MARIPKKKKQHREWVGGRFPGPGYVEEAGVRFRPEVVLWLDLTDDFVVGHGVCEPNDAPEVVVEVLLEALREASPLPTHLRVAEPALGAAIRERLDGGPQVVVGATPEIDAMRSAMTESLAGDREEKTYLEGGAVAPENMARFFYWAARLYEQAPWELLADNDVLSLDIPAVNQRHACVSIVGAAKEAFGFVVFDSIASFERFGEAVEGSQPGRPDLGSHVLAISFERGADLPPLMRREVAEHGWEVFDAHAHPVIHSVDADCVVVPPCDDQVAMATACTAALAQFFAVHGDEVEARVDLGLFPKITPPPFVLEGLPGRPQATVLLPHPGAHWLEEGGAGEEIRRDAPEALRPKLEEIQALIDAVCTKHLDEEYAAASKGLADVLARLEPSPLVKAKAASWAAAIVYTVGSANFLFDATQTPTITARELPKLFGVSQSNAAGKATTIKKILEIFPGDPRVTLPSRMVDNPLVWLIEVDGMVADARTLPRTIQKRAVEMGLIPFLPP